MSRRHPLSRSFSGPALRAGIGVTAAAILASGLTGIGAAQAAAPMDAAVAADVVAAPDVWTPPVAIDRTAEGSAPTGTWSPTAEPAPSPGTGTGSGLAKTSSARTAATSTAPAPGSGAGTGLGLLSTYTTESFGITDRLGAQVNVGTGNLIVASTDASVAAPGLSLTVNRFYNSRATGAGAFGAGSVMSTGRDIGLAITASTITFYGPSGFASVFTSNGSGGWTMPAGINADLKKNTDGTYALTYRRSGETLTFSSGGFLTADADRNGNTITPLYNADGSLASLTDTVGRVTSFNYSGDRVIKMTDPAGRVTSYGYSNAATGLYKLGYRYYDPAEGRFTQPDPSGQEPNAFQYAGSDPVSFVDSDGLIQALPGGQGSMNPGAAVVRGDVTLSGGRSGGNVGDLVAPPNSVVRGSSSSRRVYLTNESGQVIRDITPTRIKVVVPGQAFSGLKITQLTRQEYDTVNSWITALHGP